MTALDQAARRDTRGGATLSLPVKATSQIWQGGIVALLAGVAIAGRAAATYAELATLRIVGVADHDVLGGASNGVETVTVSRAIARFDNSAAGDAIAVADIGAPCFLVDDQTVAKTVGTGLRPIAGKIIDVDAAGVWVEVGALTDGGPRKVRLPFAINETDTLAGTSAELVSPVAGAIVGLSVIVQKAVTTGGDVTVLVGVTAVDGLACTVADAAAKGTVVSDTPTAGHATTAVAAGGRIQVAPAAAFNLAGAVSGFVDISY